MKMVSLVCFHQTGLPQEKNYLMYEIQGTEGTVYYSSERMNEVKVYFTSDNSTDRGFRTIFLGPDH